MKRSGRIHSMNEAETGTEVVSLTSDVNVEREVNYHFSITSNVSSLQTNQPIKC